MFENYDRSKLLTEQEVAEILGLNLKTLYNWRRAKYGPSHFKMGRVIRYSVSDLELFMKSERTEGAW